jgi:hypothetical protein
MCIKCINYVFDLMKLAGEFELSNFKNRLNDYFESVLGKLDLKILFKYLVWYVQYKF